MIFYYSYITTQTELWPQSSMKGTKLSVVKQKGESQNIGYVHVRVRG